MGIESWQGEEEEEAFQVLNQRYELHLLRSWDLSLCLNSHWLQDAGQNVAGLNIVWLILQQALSKAFVFYSCHCTVTDTPLSALHGGINASSDSFRERHQDYALIVRSQTDRFRLRSNRLY